jgi:hypothetical protein
MQAAHPAGRALPQAALQRAAASGPHLARCKAGAVQRLLDGREHDELGLLARGAHGDLRRLVLDRCAAAPRARASAALRPLECCAFHICSDADMTSSAPRARCAGCTHTPQRLHGGPSPGPPLVCCVSTGDALCGRKARSLSQAPAPSSQARARTVGQVRLVAQPGAVDDLLLKVQALVGERLRARSARGTPFLSP